MQVGKVVRVYQDMDLRIHVKNSVWTYNPRCVQPLQPMDGNNMQNSECFSNILYFTIKIFQYLHFYAYSRSLRAVKL